IALVFVVKPRPILVSGSDDPFPPAPLAPAPPPPAAAPPSPPRRRNAKRSVREREREQAMRSIRQQLTEIGDRSPQAVVQIDGGGPRQHFPGERDIGLPLHRIVGGQRTVFHL